MYSRSNLVSKSWFTILFSEYSISLLTVFVTARDIYSFMILSNENENAIEIGLNLKQGYKCAKYPIVFGS